MNKLAGFFCFLILAVPALAVEGSQVMYVGGSATGVVAGALGNLDMTSETVLIFQSAAGKIEIPYAAIQSFEYSSEVSHHLGVMPAIAVSLLKVRQHRHYFRVSYERSKGYCPSCHLRSSEGNAENPQSGPAGSESPPLGSQVTLRQRPLYHSLPSAGHPCGSVMHLSGKSSGGDVTKGNHPRPGQSIEVKHCLHSVR